jgi:hypothetical protein
LKIGAEKFKIQTSSLKKISRIKISKHRLRTLDIEI